MIFLFKDNYRFDDAFYKIEAESKVDALCKIIKTNSDDIESILEALDYSIQSIDEISEYGK